MDKGGAKAERGYPGPTRGVSDKSCRHPKHSRFVGFKCLAFHCRKFTVTECLAFASSV